MIVSQLIPRFPALALLMLLAAALLVSSVDAVACGPAIEQSSAALVDVDNAKDASPKGHGERGGIVCGHGHCHAGSQALASDGTILPAEKAPSTYTVGAASVLNPPVRYTLEYPPKA